MTAQSWLHDCLPAALALNARGYAVTVLEGKAPVIEAWQTIRLTEADLQRELTKRNGNAGIGVITGRLSGNLVNLDFDLDGWETAANTFDAEWPETAKTPKVKTGSGKQHTWLRSPDMPEAFTNETFQRPDLDAKIELRGNASNNVVPPSIHPDTGLRYEWAAIAFDEPVSVKFAELYRWLCEWEGREKTTWDPRPHIDVAPKEYDGQPGSDYIRSGDWRALILAEGWQQRWIARDQEEFWTRPGKDPRKGHSATWSPMHGTFYVFSSGAAPLEENTSYTPFKLYATLKHSGDFTAAARDLRTQGFGDKRTSPMGDDAEAILTIPDLPWDIDQTVSPWIDSYVTYAQARSPMTPNLFHEGAALFLASTIIARRLCLHMAYGDIYTNIAQVWVAPTTLWHKTTAQQIARGIAARSFPQLLSPQDVTQEQLLSDWAGHEPINLSKMTEQDALLWQDGRHYAAQRGWVLDEMSGLLASAGKDYNGGLIEAILRLYDCDDCYTRSTRSQGRVTVRSAYLSFLGASTPTALGVHLTAERLWSMGWWARFAILTPDTERPEWVTPKDVEEPPQLMASLRRIFDRLPRTEWPNSPRSLTVSLGDGVFDAWQRFSKVMSYDLLNDDLDSRLWGWYGRAPTHCLKVAMIVAALDWPEGTPAPRVEMQHLSRALAIVNQWRASTHRALAMASQSETTRLQARVIRQVSMADPKGTTMRELAKSMKDAPATEIDAVLRELILRGEVMAVEQKSGPAGGKPTTRFRINTLGG